MDFTFYKKALYQYFANKKNILITEQNNLVIHKEDTTFLSDENLEFDKYGNPNYMVAFSNNNIII
jgi:hypothetical protein